MSVTGAIACPTAAAAAPHMAEHRRRWAATFGSHPRQELSAVAA